MYEFIYNANGQILGLMLTSSEAEIAHTEGFLIIKDVEKSWEDLPRLLISNDKGEGFSES
ncbi:hypothetical protein RCI39_001059 [Enterobacter hormaechei]|nr:hypothetical protein [Enterobacter hormaechei]